MMENLQTNRYRIQFEELSAGGAGGYESKYLIGEGEPASKQLYILLSKMNEKLLPAENRSIRQRNGSGLVKVLSDGKGIGIASGFKPSGAYHFGHKSTSSAVRFFQKNGAQIFIPVANIECDMDTTKKKREHAQWSFKRLGVHPKETSIDEAAKIYAQYWAADNLVDWGANGVDLDAAHVYLQSEERRVNDLSYILARGLTFNSAIEIYGFKKLCGDPKGGDKESREGEFPFLFAGITQVGDIILPQHSDFGNYHSFMVSGQDQDGHMKMTINLVERTLKEKRSLLGLKTLPSGFYIPHIRGFRPKNKGEEPKMSSSWEKGTLYLGSGELIQDLDERITSSLRKIDGAYKNPEYREYLTKCALDLVRYLDSFNQYSTIDFAEILSNLPNSINRDQDEKRRQGKIDSILMEECQSVRQDNIALVKDSLPEVLKNHQKRRADVIRYAIQRTEFKDIGGWAVDQFSPNKPSFWEVPSKAVVDETKRNATKWYDLVAAMKERLVA